MFPINQEAIKVIEIPRTKRTPDSTNIFPGGIFKINNPSPAKPKIEITRLKIGRFARVIYTYSMDSGVAIILAVIVLGFAITLYLLRQWLNKKSTIDPTIAQWLQATSHQFNERLDNASRVMADVQKNLGEVTEVGRGIKSLQDFLQSPKLRGGLGEELLNEMVGQSFPKNKFHLQYAFRTGSKVDVAIETKSGLLCVDSKFPMENFNKMLQGDEGAKREFISDVKKHISDIAKKYILPEENTTDFALMYIPSESIYYEIVNLPELMKYSRSSRVYPVSPSTFYAHLQMLLVSFQGNELEAKSKQVFQLLKAIQKDYGRVEENLGTLGKHITNANNQMNNVAQSFSQMGQKLSSTERLGEQLEEESKQLEI